MSADSNQPNDLLRDVYRTLREQAQTFVNLMPDPDQPLVIPVYDRLDCFAQWCSRSHDAAYKALAGHDKMSEAQTAAAKTTSGLT